MAKASEIAALLGVTGCESDAEILRISGIPAAGPDALVFAMDEEALVSALASAAGLILGPPSAADAVSIRRRLLKWAQCWVRAARLARGAMLRRA